MQSEQEKFLKEPNNCVEVVVVCYSGHGNGKFLKDNVLWKTSETKFTRSDVDIASYNHKPLLKDTLGAFFKAGKPTEVVESRWLQSLIDELCKNVKPATKLNEAASSMKDNTITGDLESPQSDMDASVEVKGMPLNIMLSGIYCIGYVFEEQGLGKSLY